MAGRWLAYREGGHPHYVERGSQLDDVYARLGYVEVPAPGSEPDPVEPDVDDLQGAEIEPGETFDEPYTSDLRDE